MDMAASSLNASLNLGVCTATEESLSLWIPKALKMYSFICKNSSKSAFFAIIRH